jgi:hypothetical protein
MSQLFHEVPSLSFEDSETSIHSEVEQGKEGAVDHTLGFNKRISRMERKFDKLKMKWPLPFKEIQENCKNLALELNLVGRKLSKLAKNVGVTKTLPYIQANSLWDVATEVDAALTSLEASQGVYVEGATERFEKLQEVCQAQSSKIIELESALSLTMTRLNNLKPLLMQFKGVIVRGSVTPSVMDNGINLDELQKRVMELEKRLQDKEAWQDLDGSSLQTQEKVNFLDATLRDHEAKIKVLENRVVGEGVQLGNLCFQTFDELQVWASVHVPTGRFGLFVDGHSLMEFFTSSVHLDTTTSAAAESHAEKAGYATWQETVVAGSFKNLYPSVFGKGGAEEAICLPAITSGDKWSDGVSGVAPQMMRSMNDISRELDSSIKVVLQNHPEARQLAMDCVTQAKRFVIDLITFMSAEYASWQTRGLDKKGSWKIVCQIVRKVFEDMQSARISARSARDRKNTDFSTATFIFATLKCHKVMAEYMQHRFEDHPSVSSVVTRHLASHFMKTDNTGAGDKKLSSIVSKIDALEARINSIQSKNSNKKVPEAGK